MSSSPSLYIPVISVFMTENYIKKVFKDKNIGKVLKVEFVKNLEKNRYEAFIHSDDWFDTNESNNLKKDILDSTTKTKFVYNDNNKYWPLLVNKNPHKRIHNPKYKMLKSNEVKNVYANSLNKLEFAKPVKNVKKAKVVAKAKA